MLPTSKNGAMGLGILIGAFSACLLISPYFMYPRSLIGERTHDAFDKSPAQIAGEAPMKHLSSEPIHSSPPILEAPTICHWKFVKFHPSPYERYWTENVVTLQNDVCAESNKQILEVEEWMAHAVTSANHQEDLPESVFSKFEFQNNCTGETVTDYIEPLAGLTRSPFFCLKGEGFLVQKEYLVISWNVSRKVAASPSYTPKSFIFDLGASTFNNGAGGASQSWFVETYEARGVRWDGIYAWEVTEHPPSNVWSLIPAHLKPIYHWYNIPVNPEPNHPDNAMDYIKRVARPEDFVVLKIDIDNSPVEEALVNQLLASDELLGLVDDFFFEHHVNVGPMNGYWASAGYPRKLEDTYRIFSTLRSKGVMAHAWV